MCLWSCLYLRLCLLFGNLIVSVVFVYVFVALYVVAFVVVFVVVFVSVFVVVFVSASVLVFLGELHCSRRTEFLKGRPRTFRVGASTSPDGWWPHPCKQVEVRVAIIFEVSLEVFVFKVNECAVR